MADSVGALRRRLDPADQPESVIVPFADVIQDRLGMEIMRQPFQALIDQGAQEGEFSAQQSITETIFEKRFMHVADELYSQLRGPAKNVTVLATAYADPAKRGTGRHEPSLLTIDYGEGAGWTMALAMKRRMGCPL